MSCCIFICELSLNINIYEVANSKNSYFHDCVRFVIPKPAREDLSGIISNSAVGSMALMFVFYTVEASAEEISKWHERSVGQ